MRRVGRRWHRWGRFHWYLGNATGPLGSYGFSRSRRSRPHLSSTLALGPLYVSIWPKRVDPERNEVAVTIAVDDAGGTQVVEDW